MTTLIWPMTELGTAERLASEFGDKLRWCQELNSWMVYRNGVWVRENREQSKNAAIQVGRAQRISHPQAQTDMCTASKISNVLKLAKPYMAVELKEFDSLTGVLNFTNGTLDIASRTLLPHNPGHYLTQQIPYEWDPDAICPVWDRHVAFMCKDRDELVDLLWRAAGMSIWGGSDRDQVFVHLRGKGRNGKGVFLRAMEKALGDYGRSAPINLLTLGESAHSTEYMTLRGTRFVSCSELGTRKLNLGVLKLLTGGDDVTARPMRGDNVTFRNTWTMWLATNYSLNTTGDSADALWERYVPLDLGDMIPETLRDHAIEEKLAREVESGGIVRWLVDGCLKWKESGKLHLPESVKEWRGEERESSDVFGTFVEEKLELISGGAGKHTPHKILLSDISLAYQIWADMNGENLKMPSKAISADLRTRFGLKVEAGAGNKRTVYGVRWKDGSGQGTSI